MVVATMLGGLGLFLLAVSMISDGLKLAAGDALRDILARSTATPFKGVASGMLVTGLVQSSSAVTVATIGFVNAGLLNLTQALGIVYGANIGTTMTGWLVAAVGFEFKIDAFALPLIGLGMALRLTGKATRHGALGEALAGFGLFFIGVDFLREAFIGFTTGLDVTRLSPETPIGVLLYVMFGFIATLVTQSSSAAIAITLTAASGGVLAIDAAAAMVIGANVGTTSTAALSVIGATPNAKRVAAAHVTFNLLTGVVALALLPVLLRLVDMTGDVLGLERIPAVTLALFHSVFNILGVLLMWRMTGPLANFLSTRFVTTGESLGQPMYLDKNVVVTPSLGVNALYLELDRIAELVWTQVRVVLQGEKQDAVTFSERNEGISALCNEVENFVSRIERERLPADLAARLPTALRINQYLEEVANLAILVKTHRTDIDAIRVGEPGVVVDALLNQIVELVDHCAAASDSESLDEEYQALQEQWHRTKSVLLEAAANRHIPVGRLNFGLERVRSCIRMAEQSVKAVGRMQEIRPIQNSFEEKQPEEERLKTTGP